MLVIFQLVVFSGLVGGYAYDDGMERVSGDNVCLAIMVNYVLFLRPQVG